MLQAARLQPAWQVRPCEPLNPPHAVSGRTFSSENHRITAAANSQDRFLDDLVLFLLFYKQQRYFCPQYAVIGPVSTDCSALLPFLPLLNVSSPERAVVKVVM